MPNSSCPQEFPERRGTIEHEKGGDGKTYVYLDADASGSQDEPNAVRDELVEELRDRVTFLQHQLELREEEARRKDHLLAVALERRCRRR
jgi:hypothetical protein